jgi:hypothetical protein
MAVELYMELWWFKRHVAFYPMKGVSQKPDVALLYKAPLTHEPHPTYEVPLV